MCVYFSGVSKATWSGSFCAYFYKSACIEDPALLQSRLKKCELSPPGWTFIDNQTSSLVSVQLYKLPQFASDAGVVYIVEINQTMSWKLNFGESVIWRSTLFTLFRSGHTYRLILFLYV